MAEAQEAIFFSLHLAWTRVAVGKEVALAFSPVFVFLWLVVLHKCHLLVGCPH